MYVLFQKKKVSYKKRQMKLSLQHSEKINMKAKQVTGKEGLGRRFPKVGHDMLFKEMGEDIIYFNYKSNVICTIDLIEKKINLFNL